MTLIFCANPILPNPGIEFQDIKMTFFIHFRPLQILTNKLLKEMKLFDLAERWKNLGLTGEKITNFSGITIFSFRYSAIAENKMPKDEKRI